VRKRGLLPGFCTAKRKVKIENSKPVVVAIQEEDELLKAK
jgi:hypothetical protein